jgi:hypothetical protein
MRSTLTRRAFVGAAAGASLGGWLGRLAAEAPAGRPKKACILLWMAGGPSHIDTFDPKPDAPAEVRGEFKPIDTAVLGIRIGEHFPRLAKLMKHAAVLRGMSTLESDHKLATYHLHTGYQNRSGAVAFPGLGALVAKELGKRDVPLPNYVCIGRNQPEGTGAGFLGPHSQPLAVTEPARGLDFIEPLAPRPEFDRQVELIRRLESAFDDRYKSGAGEAHRSALDRAVRLMTTEQKRAFDLSLEPAAVREAYGKPSGGGTKPGAVVKTAGGQPGSFGAGCLMARRLVEAGVPFVEVVMGDGAGWDTHRDNFPRVRALSQECDVATAALVEDLERRGLLDTTLVVWMGEFGRTPQCTGGGRNHWARAWSTVLIGGGIKGGQVVGRTDRDAAAVVDRPIGVTDFLGTVYTILGIDYTRKNHPPGVDRPVPVVDTSKGVKPLAEVL